MELFEIAEGPVKFFKVQRPMPDEQDMDIALESWESREEIDGPRIGDFVEFSDGVVHRFSHDWGDGMQTSKEGSIYLRKDGSASFSGGLNPCIPVDTLENTGKRKPGAFWFFHHDHWCAHNGVRFTIPCRVFKTPLKSTHWHREG